MPLVVPHGENAAALADWAELLILADQGSSVSITRLGRLLQGEGSDLAEEELSTSKDLSDGEDVQQEVELDLIDEGRGELDFRLEQLLDEVSLRLKLGPQSYPFEHRQEHLQRRDAPGARVYRLLLALSWKGAPCRGERRTHEVEAAYDRVALAALRRYLGRNAKAVRFAKNAHDPEDNATRPKKFREAIAWLREQLELGAGRRVPPDDELEPHWENDPEDNGRTPLNSYSDGGVDLVAWWRFEDKRSGSPVLLAQCTVQLEWGEKVKDIDPKLWDKWIDFATVPPQTALVLPFAVSRDSEQWDDRTVTAGVIIDRLRLLELLDEIDANDLEALVDDETHMWVENELAAAA